MYLSYLLINVGENPDRPRPGRLWLRNLYRVHQRLCMAFPSNERRHRDKQFLRPYNPQDFATAEVHAPRSGNAGFLFRVEPRPGGNPVIVVQSACRPDWDYAFHNARYLLAAQPTEPKVYDPYFKPNERLRLRLKANPTRRACKNSRHPSGRPLDAKWIGKRIPVPADGLQDWLAHRAERAGFQVAAVTSTLPGYVYFNKSGERGAGHRLLSVLFEGLLEVTDPEAFVKTLQAGVGPGKAFGFGLLSVAPA